MMRNVPALILAALLLFTSSGCGKRDATTTGPGPGDAGRAPTPPGTGIEGEYVLTGMELWGEKSTPKEIAETPESEKVVKISNDTIVITLHGKQPESLKYTLDSSKSPAEIDVVHTEKGKKPETRYGIYKIEGDALTLYLMGSKEAKNRPKEFKTVEPKKENVDHDYGVLIVTLKKKSG